ncbi:MAG: hypothetical protein AB7E36_15290 [Salinivirgaceae bacterium]
MNAQHLAKCAGSAFNGSYLTLKMGPKKKEFGSGTFRKYREANFWIRKIRTLDNRLKAKDQRHQNLRLNSFFTIHYSLFTVHCSIVLLLIAHCSLLIDVPGTTFDVVN